MPVENGEVYGRRQQEMAAANPLMRDEDEGTLKRNLVSMIEGNDWLDAFVLVMGTMHLDASNPEWKVLRKGVYTYFCNARIFHPFVSSGKGQEPPDRRPVFSPDNDECAAMSVRRFRTQILEVCRERRSGRTYLILYLLVFLGLVAALLKAASGDSQLMEAFGVPLDPDLIPSFSE